MLHKIRLAIIISVASLFVANISHAAAKVSTICATKRGALIVRGKCRASESKFSPTALSQQVNTVLGSGATGALGLAGPKGATGKTGARGAKGMIDFSGCRVISNFTTNFLIPASGNLDVGVSCNNTSEFLFDDDYKTTVLPNSTGTKTFIQARLSTTQTIAGDTREYEVTIYANRDAIVGSGIYSLEVRGICCPR